MTLSLLPSEWRYWLTDATAKGCDPAELLLTLCRDGGFSLNLGRAALDEALSSASGHPLGVMTPTPGPARASEDEAVPAFDLPQVPDWLGDQRIGGRRVVVRTAVDRPVVRQLDGLLSAAECEELLRLGATRLRQSDVVEAATGKSVRHAARTGALATLEPWLAPVIPRIERRLAELAGWPLERFEHLQLIRYRPRQQYRPHFDWFDPAIPGSAPHLARGGQRVGTFVICLAEPTSGGATCFPRAGGLRIAPRRGSGVWFRNVDEAGRPDPDSLHGGDPVTAGTKWIVTAWLRATTWRCQSSPT
jgi:prolyl 4-hydroxylase